VGEIIEVDGRLGLEYQRVEAFSMLRALMRAPWDVSRFAIQLAELQAAMHACKAQNLPPMRQRLERKIRNAASLPDSLRQAALNLLATLPEGEAVCHGDFHVENILMTSQGPMVIDWIDATCGHPLGDVARTALLTVHGALPPGNPLSVMLNLLRKRFYRTYEQHYFSQSPYSPDQVQVWLPVIAAARLDEGIQEEQQNLIRIVRQGLAEHGPL
jgi:aminoglycoside phosphotransferase (APT) family kinase protein